MNVNYFDPINMERVCRICLTENANLSPIFNVNEPIDNYSVLSKKIELCGAIEVNENDGLPPLICDVCIYKASVAYDFRQQCQHSDARLRLYHDKPPRPNGIEISTQTDVQARYIMSKKEPEQPNYFTKEEMQGLTQQLSNTIQVYTDSNESVINANPIETQDKLFLCDIDFTQGKEIDKGAVILATHPSHQEICPTVGSQVTIDIAMETGDSNNQVTTITELKPSEVTTDYIDQELMTSTNHLIAGDSDNIIVNSSIENEEEEDEDDEEDDEDREILMNSNNIDIKDEYPDKMTDDVSKRSTVEDDDDDNDDNGSENSGSELKFKCESCGKRFNSSKRLNNHLRVHDKQYKCPTCLKMFFKLETMEKHQEIHELKPHACQLCHKSFAKSKTLEKHLEIHLDKDSNNSNNNNNNNNNNNSKDNNKASVNSTSDIKILNGDGDQKIKSESTMKNSDRNLGDKIIESDDFDSKPGLFKCDVCDQFCSTLKNLKRHSLIHGDKKYSCTVCKKWFFRPDTLKKHAEKHGHGLLDNLIDENKLYESDDETFNRSRITKDGNNKDLAIKNGIISVINNDKKKLDDVDVDDESGSGEYKCQHCDKIMTTKKGLRRHVSMHKPKAEPATCEICKKVCASQARLLLHQRTHNKTKEKVAREYLCHICSKVYPSNSSLTYHMRTHTGVKPHVCKTCNSGFTTTTSLANHIRIHTGDKPFVCHVCSAAFAVSSAFRRHLTRHTGEANYLCKTCGKAFKRLSTLKEHTYTHSGEKPYVCKTCGAAYSHSGSLFAHQKRCRAQYGEIVNDEHQVNVNNVQSAVRSISVIGQIF